MKFKLLVGSGDYSATKEYATLNTYLRNAEYYSMLEKLDKLHADSKRGKNFNKLMDLISSRENILLAYRTIKTNSGSKTPGIDQRDIRDLARMNESQLVTQIQQALQDFKPGKVRRVFIPKSNGTNRPLGIPTIRDRLIQQCIRQILEPILEAKFFKHSYGFRPFRSAHHAVARVQHLINSGKFYYVVDIDIKSFFDNVNHKLLMKQLWSAGIRDLQLRAIIKKMLKAPIEGEGIPTKGTPQGGILSPLLANVVLNDLDHWVANQWETFKTKHNYVPKAKYTAQKKTKLKEGFIVRYADDFKILAKSYRDAWKWFYAVREYLYKRLKLEISPEKSRVINLRKRRSEFLGFEIKAYVKGKKIVAKTFVSEKSKKRIKKLLNRQLEVVRKSPNELTAHYLNAKILGVHNYYQYATNVSRDFAEISTHLHWRWRRRLLDCAEYAKPHGRIYRSYRENYSLNYKTWRIKNTWIFPVSDIRMKINKNHHQKTNPYTPKGREHIQKKIEAYVINEIQKLMQAKIIEKSTEYIDNRLSRYSMVKGKCEISGILLSAEEVHCHHVVPISHGGEDSYDNLRILHSDMHILVHARKQTTICKLLEQYQLTAKQLDKLNQLRRKCNLKPIEM